MSAPVYNSIPSGFPVGWPGKFLTGGMTSSGIGFGATFYPFWGISSDGLKFYDLPHPVDPSLFTASSDDSLDTRFEHSNQQPFAKYKRASNGNEYRLRMVYGNNWQAADPITIDNTKAATVFTKLGNFIFEVVGNSGDEIHAKLIVLVPNATSFVETDLPPIADAANGTAYTFGWTGTAFVAFRGNYYDPGSGGYTGLNPTYYTSTNGVNWTARTRSVGFPSNPVVTNNVNGSLIVAVGGTGGDSNPAHVAIGTADGITWYTCDLTTHAVGTEWYQTTVTMATSGLSGLIGGNKIHRTTDGGRTFGSALAVTGFNLATIRYIGKKYLLQQNNGTDQGLHVSDDDGATFRSYTLPGQANWLNAYSDGTTYFFPDSQNNCIYHTTDFTTFGTYNLVSGDIFPSTVDYVPTPPLTRLAFLVLKQMGIETMVKTNASPHAQIYQTGVEVMVKVPPYSDTHGGFA